MSPGKPTTTEPREPHALSYDEALALVRARLPMAFPRVSDVAAFFGVQRRAVWVWATYRGLGYVRPGGTGHRVYPHEAIARFIVQNAALAPDFSSAEGPAPGAAVAAG